MSISRRRLRLKPAVVLLLFLLSPRVGVAQDRPVAFTDATVITMAGDSFDPGLLVVQHGRILTVGPANGVIPADAEIHECAGKVIIPGLVDTHSHIGAVALADPSAPIQPDIRVIDSIDVRDPSLRRALAGGITTVNVMPGSGLLVGGQTLYLKLRRADTIDGLLLTNHLGRIAGGLKMANGTNPQRDAPFPGTRGKAAALVREKFIAAQEYRDKLARAVPTPRNGRRAISRSRR